MKIKSTLKISLLVSLFYSCLTQKGLAQIYVHQNINLLGTYDNPTIPPEPVYGIRYNGIWGWDDGAGKEYAILGGGDGVYFVEVTNPAVPALRDFVPGVHTMCIWRELKTYGNYCYMVSDDGTPNSFMIADLSYLPDSVHLVHNGTSIIERSHTIFIDGNKMYLGSPKGGVLGNGGTSLAVFSLANPVAPVLLRRLNQDYPGINSVHDMFVRNDTIYASCGFDGLYIYKFNSNNTFTLISSLTTYPDQGYNHMTGLTDDGNTMIMMDEVPNQLAVKVVDVSTIINPQVVSTFKSSLGDTPHNPFVLGNKYVVCANYQDGVWIYDISNPLLPFNTGYFDTHHQTAIGTTSFGYLGSWGAYPYLPSGIILSSDMQNGLFVLDASAALGVGINEQHGNTNSATVYYNASSDCWQLSLNLFSLQNVNVEIIDMTGKEVYSHNKIYPVGKHDIIIPSRNFSGGIYAITVNSEKLNVTKKVCKPQ